jgi:undecaprenyl-diphosphatase
MKPSRNTRQSILDFYGRWLSPNGYLGLHLVLGFALATFCGYLFAEIADEVFFESHQYVLFDTYAQVLVKNISSPGLTSAMRVITNAGDPITLAVLSILLGVVLLLQHSHRRLYAFSAIMIGGWLLNLLLKDAFHRSRPDKVLRLIQVGGYSFPSGHSMGSMLLFGGLAYVLFFSVQRHWALRIAGIFFCLLAVLMIGASRVYLGVHYLSDVAGGFVAGLAWIGICITGTEGWIRLRDRRKAAAEK